MKRSMFCLMIILASGPLGIIFQGLQGLNEALAQGVVVPDFQVNENGGGAGQYAADVARNGSGQFVMIWRDERNGDSDIYGQRFSSDGTPSGDNFRVSADGGSESQGTPSVAIDSNGNFVIVWNDERVVDEDDNIYAQRFSSDGTPLGSNFQVNDGGSTGIRASIAAAASGAFVIVWEDHRNGNTDLYAQRYAVDGTALGANFMVNDDGADVHQSNPSVAMDAAGNFVMVWTDYRGGGLDTYGQRFASDGTPMGVNFKVNDDAGSARQFHPTAAFAGTGDFVVTWMDERDSPQNIYAQRYAADGTLQGVNFQVTEDIGTTTPNYPAISSDLTGKFVISWHAFLNSDLNIYAQRFAGDGTALGGNFLINDDSDESWQQEPSVSLDDDGNFVLAWRDSRNGNRDIFAQTYASDGTAQGANFLINQDSGSAHQYSPSVTTDSTGNFVIAWEDERNGFRDIYAQRYLDDGTSLGSNFMVNDDGAGSAHQSGPSVSSDLAGNFVVAWEDGRDGGQDIYAQRYASDGALVGSNWKVNDDVGSTWQYAPVIATNEGGSFAVVWEYQRDGDHNIYAQRYDADGNPLGGNFKVNDDPGNEIQVAPSLDILIDGSTVFVWEDNRSGSSEIYAQRYNGAGAPQGPNMKVNIDPGIFYVSHPSVSFDADLGFLVAWEDGRNDQGDIYAQRYDNDGFAVGDNFQVNDDGTTRYQGEPSVSVNADGQLVIVWYDERGGDGDVYAQRYESDGTPVRVNFLVSSSADKIQRSPDVALSDDLIYTTWVDSRAGGTGYDIWANVLTFGDPIGIGDNITPPGSLPLALDQNYPNPFNPTTTITFDLPGMPNDRRPVSLMIFDLRGRLVRSLVDAELESGRHQIHWDGRNDRGESVASGLFFYTLRSEGEVYTRKMTVIK